MSKFNTLVRYIATNKTMASKITEALTLAYDHFVKHQGDTNLLNQVLDAFVSNRCLSTRKLIGFTTEVLPVKVTTTKGGFKVFKLNKSATVEAANIDWSAWSQWSNASSKVSTIFDDAKLIAYLEAKVKSAKTAKRTKKTIEGMLKTLAPVSKKSPKRKTAS